MRGRATMMRRADSVRGPAAVQTLTLTCRVAPSQWEGQLRDGRMFYVRVRHGKLRVHLSNEPTSDVMDAAGAPPVLDIFLADSRESFMDEVTMREMTASVLDFAGVAPADLGADL